MVKNSLSFFSLFDPRLRPKGSRDPLGSEAVWGNLGRRLVGNLTTVTSNLESFFVALLSCDYAHQSGVTEIAQLQERFARMEQALAYLRLSFPNKKDKQVILGITKAKSRLTQAHIALGLAHPLLTNQLSMGLWGYYTPAMARAGLIDGETRLPTESGQEVVNLLKAPINEVWNTLCEYADNALLETSQLNAFANLVESKVFYQPQIRTKFVESLIEKNSECRAQALLYEQTQRYLTEGRESGTGSTLQYLDYIQTCNQPDLELLTSYIKQVEPLLVINNHVFNWLQGEHGSEFGSVIDSLQQRMNVSSLSIPSIDLPHHQFLQESANLLNQTDALAYFNHLLAHHKLIMENRHGAPWVEVIDNKMFVRVVSHSGKLPSQDNGFSYLKGKLENSYFLSSFLSIAKQALPNHASKINKMECSDEI